MALPTAILQTIRSVVGASSYALSLGSAAAPDRAALAAELATTLGRSAVEAAAAQVRVIAFLDLAAGEPGPLFDRLWDQSRPDDLLLVDAPLAGSPAPIAGRRYAPGELGDLLMLSGWRPLGRVDADGVEHVVAQRTTIMPHAFR